MKFKRKTFSQNKMLFFSLSIMAILLFTAVFASYISPYDPLTIDLDHIKESPNFNHWFGTDTIGRDILSRVIYGCRISLLIGVGATILSLCLGLLAGLIAGYFGGKVDTFFTIIIDIFLAFPSLLLAIGISVLLPPGLLSTTIALCLVGWASFARLFRGMVFSFKESVFVDAARSIGSSHLRIIFVHILPHCIPIAVIVASLKVGGFILSESALSFLGLGVQPPFPTWGSMVSLNRGYLPSAPWMVFFPGGAIALTVFVFNMFGDALRDMLDPKLKI
jgi:ABC-type dipeptide/oligopeptide/nickel transport system permease subunit